MTDADIKSLELMGQAVGDIQKAQEKLASAFYLCPHKKAKLKIELAKSNLTIARQWAEDAGISIKKEI